MIHEKDGIHIETNEKVVADARTAKGDINFVSHAHADHAAKEDGRFVCSELTRKIMSERFDVEMERYENSKIELIESGHIIGSTSALIDNQILYTGDFSPRDRLYLNGFEPVEAEKLIMETTYGTPAYRFPSQEEVEKRIKDWVADSNGPLVLFGYSLGKAQKIQQIVQKSTSRDLIAHDAIKNMNEVIEKHTDLEFRAKPYDKNKDVLEENGILFAPSRSSQADWMKKIVDKYGVKKAGFSGWANTDSFRYRGGYDETFVLSDHADFDELVETVEKVNPEKVYTHHGFDEEFASYLKREKGIDARALKHNQSSLTDF
ncbi:MAG: mRNA cleavage and polyadenylation specificity factor-like protein [Nanohaloarchaea archaeon]|nr:mRNA cleavage and polyadenylation specificity factor-like protein [Candidatus Nanohaloarchaea archaeon]